MIRIPPTDLFASKEVHPILQELHIDWIRKQLNEMVLGSWKMTIVRLCFTISLLMKALLSHSLKSLTFQEIMIMIKKIVR